jgi:hypothetical protein
MHGRRALSFEIPQLHSFQFAKRQLSISYLGHKIKSSPRPQSASPGLVVSLLCIIIGHRKCPHSWYMASESLGQGKTQGRCSGNNIFRRALRVSQLEGMRGDSYVFPTFFEALQNRSLDGAVCLPIVSALVVLSTKRSKDLLQLNYFRSLI